MSYPWESALLLERGLTVALAGYNACYFGGHLARRPRRRLGGCLLALINMALGGESLAFGLLPRLLPMGTALGTAGEAAASSLSLAVALAMAVLILRHRLGSSR
ncbi:MAG: hypothetical protein HY680_02395 [Chloroflexi bacterium]|nr:hypothetical protein [Chloroflexota bacterium]